MSTKHSRERTEPELTVRRGPRVALAVRDVGRGLTRAAALIGILAFAGTAKAEKPTLAGRWTASAMRVDWNIGDWGPSCGPEPSGSGAPAGQVSVSVAGNELILNGAGRTYSTNECWEQFPGLSRVSHSSSGQRSWQNVCKTATSDPRQATIVTTVTATDSQIHFDETGQYQFVLKDQNCTASVRRTRVLTLVQRLGEPEPALNAPVALSSAAPKPIAVARCATTGLPERLEVRPSRKLLRQGETFQFRASVVDAKGCPLNIQPTFRVVAGNKALSLSGTPGRVTVADDAPEGQARLQAAVGDRAVGVTVDVVSRERYDALLQAGTFNAEGESTEAAVARIATNTIGARSSVTQEEPRGEKLAIVAAAGSLALAFGIAGLLFVRRSRRQRVAALAMVPTDTGPAPAAPKSRDGKVCPTCREEFSVDAEFCAFDGNRLIPLTGDTAIGPTGGVCPVCGQGYDPGVTVCPKHNESLVPSLVHAERQKFVAVTRRICPVCGTQFSGDSQFCGKCGALLVPVN